MDSVEQGRHAAAMSDGSHVGGAANENDLAAGCSGPGTDSYVERALAAMKADPARRWTVASLARVAGLSRAPFARRFRDATKTSPMSWLAQHRVSLAQRLVLDGGGLAGIALQVGYSSEFALSKAFKRLVGVAPRPYRRLATMGSSTEIRASASGIVAAA